LKSSLTFLLFIIYFLTISDVELIQKYSGDYFIEIFNYKIFQIENISSNNSLTDFFGDQLVNTVPVTSGDFGWLILFTEMGYLGFLIYFLFVYSFYSGGRAFLSVLLLAFLSLVHYPSIMMPAGQLVMAMLLTFPAHYKKINNS
jgi:hypothetical protein